MPRRLLDKVREYDIVVQRVPLERLNRITMKNHQGAIAQLSLAGYHRLDNIIPQLYEDGKIPFALVLDGVTDARNFGAYSEKRRLCRS